MSPKSGSGLIKEIRETTQATYIVPLELVDSGSVLLHHLLELTRLLGDEEEANGTSVCPEDGWGVGRTELQHCITLLRRRLGQMPTCLLNGEVLL